MEQICWYTLGVMNVIRNRVVTILVSVAAAFSLGVANLMAADVPRKSPEFVLNLEDGRQLHLSKYRGKVVALGIVLTTCPHCHAMCQILNKLYGEFGGKGFQPVVAALDSESDIVAFRRQLGLTFPVGTTPRQQAYSYLQEEFRYVPQLVFIDRSGTIVAQHGGTDEFFRNEEQNMRAAVLSLLANQKLAAPSKSASQAGSAQR